MAEICSDVFDILHPSPVSLKELSAMAVSLEIWRRQVDKYQNKSESPKLEISSKNVLPDSPPAIYNMIDEYLARLVYSMDQWLKAHYDRVFFSRTDDQKHILQDFDNFVCDYNGTIDYLRTAERMMLCDRLDLQEKFVLACTYFFENDIRRIWPYVCEKVKLSTVAFSSNPQLYYWISCLENRLDWILSRQYIINDMSTVDERMLDHCMSCNRRSVEYFWDRISLERQMHNASYLLAKNEELFTRFVLPKLNDQQVGVFMNAERGSLMKLWLINRAYDEETILQLWIRFRTVINESTFKRLVVMMLSYKIVEYRGCRTRIYIKPTECSGYININTIHEKWTYLCTEIWNNAPDYLKILAIEDVLFKSELFSGTDSLGYIPDNVGILLPILAFALFEDRNKFWHCAWPKLIQRTRTEHLQRIMELCFKTQDEISQFKQNVLTKSEDFKHLCRLYLNENCFEDVDDFLSWSFGNDQEQIYQFKQNVLANSEEIKNACVRYLRDNRFEEANHLANFYCHNKAQAARIFKQQLLQSAFLSEQDTSLEFGVLSIIERLNKFIEDAYESVDEASDFKKQLIQSPFFKPNLLKMVPSRCKQLVEFVDTFITSEQTLLEIKKDLIECVKLYFRDRKFDDCVPCLEYHDNFLLWCLGSKEEVLEFERTCVYVDDNPRVIDICDSSDDDSDGCECITID
ncbi:uncharacterized protein LOC135848253 isoform X1 [Planococcus citri]|uniref:uncharacterized protein LOC135848253 isoform X1 n=1 Tax=Planococcus citri TaxID=170843 RepID=UPI0031F93447